MSATRTVVQAYFDGWTRGDVDAAYALLDPKLAFRGSTASLDGAEAFRPALTGSQR